MQVGDHNLETGKHSEEVSSDDNGLILNYALSINVKIVTLFGRKHLHLGNQRCHGVW